jgi:hypothetical protein
MSGPGEERYAFSYQILFVNKPDLFTDRCTSRWRGGRPYDQNRQSGQRHSNSRNMSAHSGNRGGQSSAPWSDSREQLATGPSQEHVPVRGFNSAESKAALRRGRHSLVIYFILEDLLTLSVVQAQEVNTRPSSRNLHVRHKQKSR